MSLAPPSPERSRALAREAAVVLALGVALAWLTSPLTAAVTLLGAAGITLHGRGRADLHAPPRAALFGVSLGLLVAYAWLVTHGDFQWDTPEVQGSAYDSLAASLRHGSAELDPGKIRGEGWRVGGKTYMYFGPLPALLRELPDLLLPRMEGRWSRLAVQAASTLSLAATSALARLQLAGNASLDARARDRAWLATMVMVGLGSPLLVIGSLAYIYHEAIAWGLAAALWGSYGALRLMDAPAGRWDGLGCLSVAAAAALLSRLTFGGAVYGLLAVAVASRLWAVRAQSGAVRAALRAAAPALLPAAAGVLAQLWYNHARFGSPIAVIDFSAYEGSKPVALGASHPLRIPTGLWTYFAIHADNLRASAPFLVFGDRGPLQPELFQGRTTPVFPLPFSALWTLPALALASRDVWRARRADLALAALPLLAQVLLVLGYYFLGYRFVADMLPLFVYALALHLRLGVRRVRALGALAGASAVVTLVTALHFMTVWWGYPPPYREQVKRALAAVDRVLH